MADERRPECEDYDQGYADGVRDGAAWMAGRAAHLLSLSGAGLRAGIRDLHRDAGTQWARWFDRRNWPCVRKLVARGRARGAGEGG